MTDRDRILGLLEEIHSLVEENGNADGTLRFDALRAIVALDFAKTEIEKMISGQIPQKRIDYFGGLCYTYIVSFKISYEESE